MKRGSDIISEMFCGYGVSHVFYMEAVLRKTMVAFEKSGISRILAHSEKGAVYMADGFARASRRVGVCMAQSVGAANLASGLQDAFLSHSPVLAITGRKPSFERHRNAYQEIDHWPLFEPVTKFNISVHTLGELPQALRQAFREAVVGAPGPVHLDIPNHQAALVESEESEVPPIVDKRFRAVPPFRPCPEPEDVKAAVQEIYAAKKPVLIFGGGAIISGAHPESLKLVETLCIPFATTVDGKGIILDSHPLCLGPVGLYGRKCANDMVAEADLVVFVGSGTGDQATSNWTIPSKSAAIIQIDIDPSELGRNYPNRVSLMADAKTALSKINETLRGPHGSSQTWGSKTTKMVTDWRKAQSVIRTSNDTPIKTERLAQAVQEALPADSSLVVDTGFSAVWGASIIELTKP
ncbi:MAG: thiamine pyrophosphate-binding protein, partial [Deltaproteobacteria bacterium]|nr:thiamine pyrophosphate-binding protein [Deltaproteobacteria bacterium]